MRILSLFVFCLVIALSFVSARVPRNLSSSAAASVTGAADLPDCQSRLQSLSCGVLSDGCIPINLESDLNQPPRYDCAGGCSSSECDGGGQATFCMGGGISQGQVYDQLECTYKPMQCGFTIINTDPCLLSFVNQQPSCNCEQAVTNEPCTVDSFDKGTPCTPRGMVWYRPQVNSSTWLLANAMRFHNN